MLLHPVYVNEKRIREIWYQSVEAKFQNYTHEYTIIRLFKLFIITFLF